MNSTRVPLSEFLGGLKIHNNVTVEDEIFNNNSNNDLMYCGQGFKDFHQGFKVLHGYFSIIVCIFGLITNILNIIVLSRKDMVTPTNAILTGLAVTDMLVMIDYLPYSVYEYILDDLPPEEKYSYHWGMFILFHAHFSVVCHTISIALTMTLAVWRYIAVSVPQKNRELCSMPRARIAIVSSYLFSIIFCIPTYLAFSIHIHEFVDKDREIIIVAYEVNLSEIAKNNDLLLRVNFWVYSVFIKLVPCIALTVLSVSLIRALYEANQRRNKLTNRNNDNPGDRSCDRTTRMLLAVLLLFLITEFPQAILGMLSGILGEDFFRTCYQNFGEVMDILALINSAINFILYCTMSRQFRQNFNQLFNPRILNKWMAIPQDPQTQATTCV